MFIKLTSSFNQDTYYVNPETIFSMLAVDGVTEILQVLAPNAGCVKALETPEQILALIEAEKVKELRDEFAKTEGLWDLANCNYHQEVMEALAGYPEPADLVESVEWESAWRAKLRYIRADAMLKAREAKS